MNAAEPIDHTSYNSYYTIYSTDNSTVAWKIILMWAGETLCIYRFSIECLAQPPANYTLGYLATGILYAVNLNLMSSNMDSFNYLAHQ